MSASSDNPTFSQTAVQSGAFEKTWPLAASARQSDTRGPLSVGALASASYQLLARARQLSTGSETERQMAIIFAESACDLQMELALTVLLRSHKGAVENVLMTLLGSRITLVDPRVQAVYGALTDDYPWGDAVKQQSPASWWMAWRECQLWRSEIARNNRIITPAEAGVCIRVSMTYLAHLAEIVARK